MEQENWRRVSLEDEDEEYEYGANAKAAKVGKKAILRFSSLMCLLASLIMIALGVFMMLETDALGEAIVTLVVGLAELQAFWILLLISSKMPEVSPSRVTDGMIRTAKIAKTAVVAALVVLLFSPLIYKAVLSGNAQSAARENLIGGLYIGGTTTDTHTEYEFVSGKKCIERTVVDTSYDLQVIETEHRYSLKKTGEKTYRLTIGDRRFEAESYSSGEISSFSAGDTYFFRRSTDYDDIKSNTYGVRQFITQYNTKLSSPTVEGGTDEQYISAAESVVVDSLKFPDSGVLNSAKVLERDGRGMAIVYLDVSASNSFGVMVRETYYVCIREVIGDRYKVSGIAAYVTEESHLPYLKSINDFGYDPLAEKNKDILLSAVQATDREVCTVNGKTLDKSVVTAPFMTVQLFTFGDAENVVAACAKIPKSEWTSVNSEIVANMLSAVNNTIVHSKAGPDQAHVDIAFTANGGTVSSTPLFLKGGFIVHASMDASNYYYSITYGRGLGITQDNVWTPISLTGQSGIIGGSNNSWNPPTTKPQSTTDKTTTKRTTYTTRATTTTTQHGTQVHNFVQYGGKAATCTESGYLSYKTCTCGYTDYQEIPAKGHDYAVSEIVQPTCETEGYTRYQCSACTDSYKDSVAATGHNYSAATCTTPQTCLNCGITNGIALGHRWDEATPRTCTACGAIDESSIRPWLTQEVEGGVEIIGIGQEQESGDYIIPGEIDGKTVVGIGARAFQYESSIKSISLPNTVTYIGDKAFADIDNLTTIYIPGSVTYIGTNAFVPCRNLTSIYIASADVEFGSYPFSTIYQRDGDLTIYASATVLSKCSSSDAELVEWNG